MSEEEKQKLQTQCTVCNAKLKAGNIQQMCMNV